MLILTRTIGEKIVIAEDIVIEVLGVTPDKRDVKLGITAPKEVTIMRDDAKNTTPKPPRK